MYAHLVDHTMSGVFVRSESNGPMQVPRELRGGMCTKWLLKTDLMPKELICILP